MARPFPRLRLVVIKLEKEGDQKKVCGSGCAESRNVCGGDAGFIVFAEHALSIYPAGVGAGATGRGASRCERVSHGYRTHVNARGVR